MPNIGPPLWAAIILASASPPVISFVDIVVSLFPHLSFRGSAKRRARNP